MGHPGTLTAASQTGRTTVSRRLSKDYEYWVYSSDAVLYLESIRIMLRRLARLRAAQ